MIQSPNASAHLLTRVTDAIPCPIAATGQNGQILAANEAWDRMTSLAGLTKADLPALGKLFPDAAGAPEEVLRGAGPVSRRALPLACGLAGVATWWDLDLVPHPDTAGIVLVTAREVTDHVLARRDSQDARELLATTSTRLQLAQEAAGIGTWEWDAAADRQAWSPQQFRLHGLDPAVAPPPSFDEWSALVHPQDRARLYPAMIDGSGGPGDCNFQIEFRIRRADTGAERWLLSRGQIMEKTPDGCLRRIIGVNLDVTEARNKHEALRENEALLRLASEAAGVYAWDWTIATGRVTWSEGLEKALGLPHDGFGGTIDAFRALVHADDIVFVEAALRQALAGETSGYRAMFRMHRADGSVRWTETRGTVIRDEHGAPIRVVGMDYDITERKVAEAELRTRERQQAAVAALGQYALGAASAQAVMDRAIEVLTNDLGVELAKALQLRPEGHDLLLRASRGSTLGFRVGETVISADPWSQAGYTLSLDAGPVIVENLKTETRFVGSSLLHDNGLVSGMSVIIRAADGGAKPYGVLSVHTRRQRRFDQHDIRFLEAVANLITAAIQWEQAQATLLERKARLRLFIEQAPAAIAMLDRDMRYLAASRQYITDHRLAADTSAVLEGQHHEAIFTGLPAAWHDRWRRVLVGEAQLAWNERVVRPDGCADKVRWVMKPWRIDGSVGGVLLFTEVVTDHPANASIGDEGEAQFRSLTDAMPQMLFVASPDGLNEYSNARWYEYSGQSREQTQGDGWLASVHPDDRDATIAAWNKAVAAGEAYEHEHRLRGRDGIYRWFLSRAVPQRGADGRTRCWVATATEVTALIDVREAALRLSAELEARIAERTRTLSEAAVELQGEMRRRQEMQAALSQSQKLEALGQLTAGVAHDFNNVLSAIQGSFDLIERRSTDSSLTSLIELGRSATARAARLTRQLLDFGRQETLRATVLEVTEALQRADEMISHAVGTSVSRTVDIQDDVWPVLTDGHQLEIALLNLAINARDAMPDGGELILAARNVTPNERPESLPPKDYVAISVQDTGQGMPARVLARATDPFYTTKPIGKGTGLGLPMVHAFALHSGGCLNIESQEGIGTTVQIILPRALVTEMHWDQTGPDAPAASEPQRTATILLVEDDDQTRQVMSGYLQDRGYTVVDAPNAEAAMILSHSTGAVDLLLTDIDMPGADGPALAKRLQNEHPGLPVLFITGGTERDDLAKESVLPKPFTGADLVRAINRRLDRRQGIDSSDDRFLRKLHNPLLAAAYLFWRAARNGNRLPRLPDLDWGDMPNGENAFIVAVMPEQETVTFRYLRVGHALVSRLGRSMTGTTLSVPAEVDPDNEILGSLEAAYHRCAHLLAPSYEYMRHSFSDNDAVLFERLILPVSDDGKHVTHLVGIALFSGNV